MKKLRSFTASNRLVFASLVVMLSLIAVSCVLPIQPTEEMAQPNVSDAPADAENSSAEANADESAETVSAETAVAIPEPEGMHKGLPVGFTAEGFPYRGSPDAPITIYEYSDYQCPFCSRYFVQTEPAIDENYVRGGQLRVVFRDFPLVDLHPNAPAAHVASLCAADQGAESYWQFHSRIFQTQSKWNQSADAPGYFAGLAEPLGLNIDEYTSCIDGGEKEAMVAQGVAEARSLGYSGTPSFHIVHEATNETFPLVGAQPYDRFAEMIDTLIAGGTPAIADPNGGDGDNDQENGEIPFWATAEGLAADPDNPGHTMAGDQYRGNPEANVIVVEFSDMQCPFCRRHTFKTQPVLDEQFVDTDQIMWVFKHFPLSIHPQAPIAGVAAECAADQGMFWEMHETLFNSMQRWSNNTPNPIFVELAGELGLDVDTFATCLDDEEVAARVQEDLVAGTPFVRGTPTFIVLSNGQGNIIPGALPAERFTEILQEVVDSSSG